MKGFVPVTKSSLGSMIVNCMEVLRDDYLKANEKTFENYVANEKTRSNSRKWYRLWRFPKPRFEYNITSVIKYAASYEYGMFDGSPFEVLESDYKNSVQWLDRLAAIANSGYALDPVSLDIKTFNRLSKPSNYLWVSTGMYYTIRND